MIMQLPLTRSRAPVDLIGHILAHRQYAPLLEGILGRNGMFIVAARTMRTLISIV
jgi:hypothetical protein